MIRVAKEEAGFFYLLSENEVSSNASEYVPSFHKHVSFNSIKEPSYDMWHYRLGHPSNSRIRLIQSIVPAISCKQSEICPICPLAKQHKLPFPVSVSISEFPFDLLHCDIWGPMATSSINGSKFFLTIMDDCTQFTWVRLMQHKSQTASIIHSFSNMVQTQFKTKIKCIRSDNGLEFHTKEFFSTQGIIHQLSCVETPQQNAIVERKHQHLLNVARSLRFQSHLPLQFWADCILSAAHIINRIPTPLLPNKSLYQLLFSKVPSYFHLKVFRCLAYVSTLSRNRKKFDPRATPCIFIGYPHNMKGYKFYNLQTQYVIISRNAIFHETIFPYATHIDHSSSPAPNIDNSSFISPETFSQFCFTNHSLTSHHFITNTHSICRNSFCSTSIYRYPSSHFPENSSPHSAESSSPNSIQNSSSISVETSTPILRKLDRIKYKPSYLWDYYCKMAYSCLPQSITMVDNLGKLYPLSSFLSYDNLSSPYKHFCFPISSQPEPKFYHHAVKNSLWCEAMKAEILALEENNTWIVTDLPPNKYPIGYKWVYKVKHKSDGSVERYKARLVAKGYTQCEGLDFHETFSQVAKMTIVRCFLELATSKNWFLHQLDVNNVFLHGDLDEEVYMSMPPGFGPKKDTKVCKLTKSLYGLKQASRQWFSKFSTTLVELGFVQSLADYSLFTRLKGSSFIALLVYVDDVAIASNDPKAVSSFITLLNDRFKLKDLGPLKYFLGLEIARSTKGISVNQRKYALEVLEDSSLLAAKPVKFPMEQNLKISKDEGDLLSYSTSYRRLVGRLLYLTITIPDLAFSVQILSQFMDKPRQTHLEVAH
jgi:hypothetical protein